MVKKVSILFFCFLLGLYSCTKDTSTDYPSAQISSPYSLAIFNVPCTIQVTGHVNDSKQLTAVNVYVANSDNIPVEESVFIPVTSNSMNVSCSYVLNDIHLPSGQYYMTIEASNGTNITSAFQQIYIDGTPTQRTALYAITRNGSGIHAWEINANFQASLSYTVPGDYSSSDINSYYQQLYTVGRDSGSVNAYSVPTVSADWNINGIISPAPYFTNIYCNNDVAFISYCNPASVKCYNYQGSIQAVYTISPGYYPIKTFTWGTWLFVEEKSISSPVENLLLFYEASTAGYNQTTIPGPVVAMYGYDNNHIFMFGNNSSGGAYLQLYNIQTNLFSSPITLPSAQLLSVAQINTNTYLLGFTNGTIYQYNYGANGLLAYLNGITASTIRYDNINNEVIVATGKTINEYNYNSATLVASTSISDSIRDVRILYNK